LEILKNGEKVGKIDFLLKIRPCLRVCKASLYRKTTWQAFIFHQKKSFLSNIRVKSEGVVSNACELAWNDPSTKFDVRLKISDICFSLSHKKKNNCLSSDTPSDCSRLGF